MKKPQRVASLETQFEVGAEVEQRRSLPRCWGRRTSREARHRGLVVVVLVIIFSDFTFRQFQRELSDPLPSVQRLVFWHPPSRHTWLHGLAGYHPSVQAHPVAASLLAHCTSFSAVRMPSPSE